MAMPPPEFEKPRRKFAKAKLLTPIMSRPAGGDAGRSISSRRRVMYAHHQEAYADVQSASGVRHGYLRHLAAVIEPQPEVSK